MLWSGCEDGLGFSWFRLCLRPRYEILPKWCGLGVGMVLVTLAVRSHSNVALKEAAPPFSASMLHKLMCCVWALLICSSDFGSDCRLHWAGLFLFSLHTLYPSSPSEAWWHCRQGRIARGSAAPRSRVPGPPTDARTEKTGHSEQSADTRNGIPDTGPWIISFGFHSKF